MKQKIWLVLILAFVMMAASCGQTQPPNTSKKDETSKSSDKEASKETSAASSQSENDQSQLPGMDEIRKTNGSASVPDQYVGTWHDMISNTEITIAKDGNVTVGQEQLWVSNASDNQLKLNFAEWKKVEKGIYDVKLDDGTMFSYYAGNLRYDQKGPYLMLNSRGFDLFPAGVFMKQGGENPFRSFLGTWVSVGDPEDKIVLDDGGASTFHGETMWMTHLNTDSDPSMIYFLLNSEDASETSHSLTCFSEQCIEVEKVWYYREGTENPAKAFYGTWTLDNQLKMDNASVESFTVKEDHTVEINGTGYACVFECGKDNDGAAYWYLRCKDGSRLLFEAHFTDEQPGSEALDVFIAGNRKHAGAVKNGK